MIAQTEHSNTLIMTATSDFESLFSAVKLETSPSTDLTFINVCIKAKPDVDLHQSYNPCLIYA